MSEARDKLWRVSADVVTYVRAPEQPTEEQAQQALLAEIEVNDIPSTPIVAPANMRQVKRDRWHCSLPWTVGGFNPPDERTAAEMVAEEAERGTD